MPYTDAFARCAPGRDGYPDCFSRLLPLKDMRRGDDELEGLMGQLPIP